MTPMFVSLHAEPQIYFRRNKLSAIREVTPFPFQRLFILHTDKRIFLVVGNCRAAVAHVDGAFFYRLFTRPPGCWVQRSS